MMQEEQFKNRFVASFLGSWCAKNFDDFCLRGLQRDLANPPVEDALFLADKAWERYLEHAPAETAK